MRSRSAAVLAFFITGALLAGCGGIPTGGSPEAGELVDDEVEIEIGFAPQGPRDGATQEEIVQDFIRAATNPQGRYAVARQFLTDKFADEWDPNEIVLVRSSAGASTKVSDTEIEYEFTTSAIVDADGRYKESSGSSTLEYELVQVGEEWRIDLAPPGIVLSDGQLDDVFRQYALFYFDPSYKYLVPDVRWFSNQSTVASNVVGALLRGQSGWLGNGVLVSAFPAGTALGPDQVSISSGVASVDLTEEVRSASNTDRDRMRQQLLASLSSLANVSSVVITVDGTPISVPDAGSGNAVSSPEVEALPLVRVDDTFGFTSNGEVTTIPGISERVIDVAGKAATLARGGKRAAVLGNGGVYAIDSGDDEPLRVDRRPGLVPPSIDTSGYIWSAQRSDAAGLRAISFEGEVHEITSSLPEGARVVSLDVSRDGARILLYLTTTGGPRLAVGGILRQDSVPTGLSELQYLPVASGVPIDATWVDDRTVATLARSGAETSVTAWTIGGPSEPLGELAGGVSIVGGVDGTDGLRVLTGDGEVFQPRGSSWQLTDVVASFLATQQ